jgi:uncharacterized protein (DUF2235 family)
MAKNIVFCADGTWNSPTQDDDRDRAADPTNVYKLFLGIEGTLEPDSLIHADEQEKGLSVGGETRQVAKYIHGVGDSRNPIVKLMGGAFGAGIISRIVRGYTFISRNYAGPDDDIFITGFSRGAYTARALAGLIASQGLLSPDLTKEKEQAYRKGAEAWYRYRKETVPGPFGLARLTEVATDLPAFISCSSLKDADLVPVGRIASVAVWDTVGALGIPDYVGKGSRADAFRFADTKLSPKVASGFHAVALDERRCDFTPTLWDPSENVTQVLFPGAHADVGGGYPMKNGESGLSDVALKWMFERLESAGLVFTESHPYPVVPDPAGTAHEPWKHGHWRTAERSFPQGTPEHPSIAGRRAAGDVVADPGELPAPYRPADGTGATPGASGT